MPRVGIDEQLAPQEAVVGLTSRDVRTLQVVNQSRRRNDAALDIIVAAIAHQLHDLASAWGPYVWQLVAEIGSQGFRVVLLDNPDQAGAAGYHDVGPDHKPYGRVFLDPIFDNRGSWLRGSNSVSATVSHEVCEVVGDPGVNRWATNRRNTLYAVELCDAVENFAYLDAATGAWLSDFVHPSYFNPFGTRPFDHLDKLREPFSVGKGGYAIRRTRSGNTRCLYGARYPHWRKPLKQADGSRTRARFSGGVRRSD